MTDQTCHCGQPLHYDDAGLRYIIDELNRTLGAYMEVEQEGKIYLVQRHYAALHGIKGKNLAELGFGEL